MLRVEKSQMIVVEGADGIDLQAKYNEAMKGLIRIGVTVDDHIISIEKMSAIILYHEIVRIPQNLKDEFELKGIFPHCEECPHYVDLGNGNGNCPRIKSIRYSLRHDDSICQARWNEMERERRWVNVPAVGKDHERKGDEQDTACG